MFLYWQVFGLVSAYCIGFTYRRMTGNDHMPQPWRTIVILSCGPLVWLMYIDEFYAWLRSVLR